MGKNLSQGIAGKMTANGYMIILFDLIKKKVFLIDSSLYWRFSAAGESYSVWMLRQNSVFWFC